MFVRHGHFMDLIFNNLQIYTFFLFSVYYIIINKKALKVSLQCSMLFLLRVFFINSLIICDSTTDYSYILSLITLMLSDVRYSSKSICLSMMPLGVSSIIRLHTVLINSRS